MVTMPAVPPYSSSTTARWVLSRFMSVSTSSTSRVPGTNSGGRMTERTVSCFPVRSAASRSFEWTTPTISSSESV